jgi:hypothetical protein
MYAVGSHTAGGSLQYTLRITDGAGTTDFSFPALDNTNNTVDTVYVNDIADYTFTLSASARLTIFLASRSGTITERSVSLGIIGTQKRI